jgi:phenylacetate-CoA ligase
MFKLTPLQPWIARKIGCQSETLTKEAIESYQLQKIRETIDLAKNKSRFYRRTLARFSSEITTFADFTCYPFTTDEDICREALLFPCVSQSEIQRVVTLDTSGTTGQPKRLFFTRDDQELTIDFFGVGMSTLVEPGDRVLILLPDKTPGSVGDLLYTGLQRLGITAIKHGPVKDAAETLKIMTREEVTSLVGVPTQVLALERYRDQEGQTIPLDLKSVLLSTDYVPQAIIRAVKDAWGCEVFNHYGMTEMGLGGGVSCTAQTGYHLREADLYIEIIDPLTGQPLPEGETGEVVFTTLTRQGMPLIRYRTGDISRFIPGTCPCGAVLKTMAWIKKRIGGDAQLGHARIAIADLDEVLFSLENLINYSATIDREGDTDVLTIEVFGYGEPDNLTHDLRKALVGIPSLQNALDAGEIILKTAIRNGFPSDLGKMSKRKLVVKNNKP